MPRFYFHIRNGHDLETDAAGTEFASLEAAVCDAKQAAREIIAEMLMTGEVLDEQRFEITDTRGITVATVPFKSTLRLQ